MTPAGSSSAVAAAPGSSYHENAYVPSSRSRANVDSRSGWNVSHITANSCVSVSPIDFSASPGCGPCGIPDGWVQGHRADLDPPSRAEVPGRGAISEVLAARPQLGWLAKRAIPRFFTVPEPRQRELERLPYELYSAELRTEPKHDRSAPDGPWVAQTRS